MAENNQEEQSKKGHPAARLWTAARSFFGVRVKSKSKTSLVAALEARNTVGGAAAHTDSKKLVGFIHPGGFVVLTPQSRDTESEADGPRS